MSWGLKRLHETRQLHYLTFSCFKKRPNFHTVESCTTFESALERVRQKYLLCVYGYVVMPEHVHMVVSEPERGTLAQAMQSLKQGIARRLALRGAESFWQARYYDFNVWSERKFVEKLRYIHRNPVERVGRASRGLGLEQLSSLFRRSSGNGGDRVAVDGREREQHGIFPTVQTRPPTENPRPSRAWTGHPRE